MRRYMTKQVTKTTIRMAYMENRDGMPEAVPMDDEIIIGNVGEEKAQRMMEKEHGKAVTVFEVIPETKTYEMEVSEFIKHAHVKE